MDDPTKLADVHIGINAKISLLSNPSGFSEGLVYRVLSEIDDPQGIIVILENGKKGHAIQIINSIEIIKHRIMTENQYSENKESFAEDVMKHKVIPLTVQSFLNSEGGYLYIGVKDIGTLEEKLVGLDLERQSIEKSFEKEHPGEKLPNEKFLDFLEMEINDVLNKYLSSDVVIGPLISINFPIINEIQILEIHITKSSVPFFFKHITKKNIPKMFELKFNNESAGQRKLDDFYIRSGGKKKLLETQEEFYTYYKNRFQKP